ncbi:sigma-54 interaction domain-containing protein [uncultured Enterovirga sp.]|uniref:sigma-54 interaction domain-containing protein n=1 Tax=uncultured Enterovirga sp. TaxID=2026352 RepID=UPI0035CC951B
MIQGVVVVGRDGRISFACGLGQDSRIRSLTTDPDWLEEAVRKRLRPIQIDRQRWIVVATPFAEGTLFLVSEPAGDALMTFLGCVDFAHEIFEHLLTDPFEAMTVVDAEARVVYLSPVHESFFGLASGEGNGHPVSKIIENTRLDKVVASGKAEIGQIQRMKGFERVVSRVPISQDGKVVGAVGRIMFKGPEQVEALSRRINALEREVEFYRREAASLQEQDANLDDLIGTSAGMQRLRTEIRKLAPLEIPVLIHGESGTGKELVAQALHRLSLRRNSPIIMVNAAALPATLVESELFGYEAGSFTGADKKGRKGKFEQAAGGTIFLDEIGDMPSEVQVKLLRVLQDKLVERVGSERPREVDFRLVTATNRDLHSRVSEGLFRLDLYYRIAPITIEVPPLRSRVEDIEGLTTHFLQDVSRRHGKPAPEITADAISYLCEQPWPGNVRQLRHEIERAFVFAERDRIDADTLVRHGEATFRAEVPQLRPAGASRRGGLKPLRDVVLEVEAELVRDAMQQLRGNKKRVAQELGISRSYLYKILGEADA